VQTTDVGYSLDAARDQIDLIDHARFISFDEVRTHSAEYTCDDAVITPASGQPIELQRVHVAALMEDNFAFDQTPMLDSADAGPIGSGAVMPLDGTIALNVADDRAELRLIEHRLTPEGGGWTVPSHSDWKINSGASSIVTLNNEDHGALIKKAGSIDAAGPHVHTIDAGSNVVLNPGVLKASESGGQTVASLFAWRASFRAFLNCPCGARFRGFRYARSWRIILLQGRDFRF
jgi:hypothetical protein